MLANSKPIQKISWSEKIKNNFQFFKDNGDYLIAGSTFGTDGDHATRNARMKALYEVYNSIYPSSWFKHVLDPFSTGSAKSWPAKIRPMNILRPNIEYLRGEYPKRPFNYQVVVKGEDGYNAFLEGKKNAAFKSISQIFINGLNEQGLDTGVETQEQPELPQASVDKFEGTYKNILAVQAQTDIDLIIEEQRVHEKLMDMMKDWLIVGSAFSYKNVLRDSVIYEHVPPPELDYDKSPGVKYVKDGSWVVRRMLMVVGDVVDRFYDSLKSTDIDKLENGDYSTSPAYFQNHLNGKIIEGDKVPVYHYTWRGMEKFGNLTFPNPITGKMEEDIVSEDYKPNKELGEQVTWMWRTRWFEGYRIADDIHVEMGPVRYAPSMMNDLAKSCGPYNGRNFSDTYAENVSVLKMGLPFQIMYIITNFTLERTIAKSRGKIALIDQAVIPTGKGWNEEKFFQFSEAQGWAVINRNQLGVDKSFNQYQTLDFGQFEHINNLIEIMNFCKSQFDEQLGISRQAKAQVTSSDTASGTQQAIFQSSVITDMIFTEFEQFRRTDLEGLLDCSQISNIHGKRSSYISSEDRTAILNIIGEEYSYAQMGILMTDSTKENDALNRLKQYGQAFAQNGTPPSAIIAIETSTNIAKLKQLLMNVETKQREIEQATAENEQEARIAEIQLQQQFEEYNNLLDIQRMHEEYNRKEDLVIIQGDINMAMVGAEPQEDSSMAGTEALMNYTNDSRKISEESDRKNKELNNKVKAQQQKQQQQQKLDAHKMKMAEKELQLKEKVKNKELAIKKIQAKRKPATSK